MSETFWLVKLTSGNSAVYGLQPQHHNETPGTTLRDRAINYGRQIAHERGGYWYKPGSWEEITDHKTIALLERCPEA